MSSRILSLLRRYWPELAYVALALGVWGWIVTEAFTTRSITYRPTSDYWEHTAALRSLLEDPLEPRNPQLATSASSPRFGPHFVLIALLARPFTDDPLDAMGLSSALNTALFVLGIYVFFRRYFADRLAPLFGLIVMFGSWFDAPHFSNVYKLSVFFSTAGYPSTAALAITLLGFALTLFAAHHPERRWIFGLLAVIWGYVFLTHPLTAALSLSGAVLIAVTEPGLPLRRRLVLAALPVAGLALAALWPYYPAFQMVAHRTVDEVASDVAEPLNQFYEWRTVRQTLGLAALGVPCILYLAVRRLRLFVVLGFASMIVPFLVGIYVQIPLRHRFILLAVFYLQIALVWLLLVFSGREAQLGTTTPQRRYAGAAIAAGLLVYAAWSNLAAAAERFAELEPGGSPTVKVGRTIGRLAGDQAVVMAGRQASWAIPTFGPRVVSLLHENPLVPDEGDRQLAVEAFYAKEGVSSADRDAILQHYGVTHVLLPERRTDLEPYLFSRGRPRSLPSGSRLFAITMKARRSPRMPR